MVQNGSKWTKKDTKWSKEDQKEHGQGNVVLENKKKSHLQNFEILHIFPLFRIELMQKLTFYIRTNLFIVKKWGLSNEIQ